MCCPESTKNETDLQKHLDQLLHELGLRDPPPDDDHWGPHETGALIRHTPILPQPHPHNMAPQPVVTQIVIGDVPEDDISPEMVVVDRRIWTDVEADQSGATELLSAEERWHRFSFDETDRTIASLRSANAFSRRSSLAAPESRRVSCASRRSSHQATSLETESLGSH